MKVVTRSSNTKSRYTTKGKPSFNIQTFLDSAELTRKVMQYRKSQKIYAQGDSAASVMYIQEGGVKLMVANEVGKEAIVAILGPTDFFGESCLAGQRVRMGTAVALSPTSILVIEKDEMVRVLHAEHALVHRFLAYVLVRNIRVEEDLVYLHREAPGADSAVTGALWRGTPTAKIASQRIPGNAGGNYWNHALPSQFFHE
jgi:CRP-like cAMP-binding protein